MRREGTVHFFAEEFRRRKGASGKKPSHIPM